MEIADWRKRIDVLDEELVRVLSERARCAQAIGELKRTSARAVYEPDRERQVIEHVRSANHGPIPDELMTTLFERVMEVMRAMQSV